jgi:hypothetical protein
VEAHGALGVLVEVANLTLELAWRGPEVVAIEHRDVLPAGPPQELREDRLAARPEVVLGQERADQVGVRPRAFGHDVPGPVG